MVGSDDRTTDEPVLVSTSINNTVGFSSILGLEVVTDGSDKRATKQLDVEEAGEPGKVVTDEARERCGDGKLEEDGLLGGFTLPDEGKS